MNVDGARSRGGQVRRVVVVEDDPEGREALRMLLEAWGHEVAVAENGNEGICLTRDFGAEVVIVDVGLPGMDGYEVARRIRAAAPGHAPFLVAFTGWTRPEDRRHAEEAGFDAYVLKPAEPDELKTLITRASTTGNSIARP